MSKEALRLTSLSSLDIYTEKMCIETKKETKKYVFRPNQTQLILKKSIKTKSYIITKMSVIVSYSSTYADQQIIKVHLSD